MFRSLDMKFVADEKFQIENEKLKARARAERFGLIFSEEDFKPVNQIHFNALSGELLNKFVRAVGCVDKGRI